MATRREILGRIAAFCRGVPVVSTYHNADSGVGRIRLYDLVDRATAWLAEPIAVSDEIRRGLPCAAALIENFVELPEAPSSDDSVPPRTVAFVGRLSHEKGPDEFCALAQDIPDLRFEIFGDGPLRCELQARHGRRVHFHGAVESMAGHWCGIGLLCMPSRREGLPMAALEAMAHGVPIAAYAVGGLRSCVVHGSSGWLAKPQERAQLVLAIRAWQVLCDGGAKAMAQSARDLVARRFSSGVGTEKVLAVYQRALDRVDPPAVGEEARRWRWVW